MPLPDQPERSLLARPLAWLTGQIVRFPLFTLALAGLFAAVSVGLAAARLEFHASRLDLLNPHSDYNALWIEYLEEFAASDDIVIVVEGPSEAEITPVLDELAAELRQSPQHYRSVLAKIDLSAVHAKGLHYLPPQELHKIEQFLTTAQPILAGEWSGIGLAPRINQWEQAITAANNADIDQPPALLTDIATVTTAFRTQIESGAYDSPWPAASTELAEIEQGASRYMLSENGRMGFVLLRLTESDAKAKPGQLDAGTLAIDKLRETLAACGERHENLTLGLTGLPVMENDEMRASQSDSLRASLISLAGVALLFIAGLGGLRHPMMTVGALLLAIAWTMGYLTLSIGHLNILSVSFGVILIGLGIDFGIHYVARYQHQFADSRDSGRALVETARSVGPGVLTGGLTTALAFFAAGLTKFTGVAELGLITGGGVLLCGLAALVVLPAMIFLGDRGRQATPPPRPLRVDRWVGWAMALPRLTVLLSILASAALAYGWLNVRYDHNLLNLQPDDLESVALEERLLTETKRSVWFAISTTPSREELLERKEKFLALESVDHVEEIASLLPAADTARLARIEAIAGPLGRLPAAPPLLSVPSPEELSQSLEQLDAALMGGTGSKWHVDEARIQLHRLQQLLSQLGPQETYAATSTFQQAMAGDLLARLIDLRAIADPAPPQSADLPPSLADRFLGRSGTHLIKIYGRGNIWDMHDLEAFVTDVKSVDPQATGQPLQTYFASRHMLRSYLEAAAYALLAVLAVLFIDLGRLRDCLLALVPMGLGLAQMFGILGLLGIPLNPANMIVLPLILGIGIDDGVHVIHDFRRQGGPYRISPSTAAAVLITSLTTMVGFGSMMLAHHEGLRSLGRVLTIGVTCCMLSSLVTLPALLRWRTLGRPAAPKATAPKPTKPAPTPPAPAPQAACPTSTPRRRDTAAPAAPPPLLLPRRRRSLLPHEQSEPTAEEPPRR